MALTKIFTGMEQGPEKIDANFKGLDANSPKILTNWTSYGITYKNGCSENPDKPNRIQYRVMQLGDLKFLNIVGWFNAPALTKGQEIVAFNIPTSIASQFNKYNLTIGSNRIPWGDLLENYTFKTWNGDFSILNASARGDGSIKAGAHSVGYAIWA